MLDLEFISGTELMKIADLCVFESSQTNNWGKCCKYLYNIDKNPTSRDIETIKMAKLIFMY